MRVELFTTVGCHLCEQALSLLLAISKDTDLEICEVEIADSESLLSAYGVRIPVVKVEGREDDLGWPFTGEQLHTFIAGK